MKLKFGIKEVVAIGIGTALFVALTEIQIPTPHSQYIFTAPYGDYGLSVSCFWACCRRSHRSFRTCVRGCNVLWQRMVELGIP